MAVIGSDLVTGSWPPSLIDKAIASTTAGVDAFGRTALSTIMATASAPTLLRRSDLGVEHLSFYADLARAGDAASTFVDPAPVTVRVRTRRPPRWMRGVGEVDDLRFDSPYEPRNPDVERFHHERHRNGVARATHWRHAEEPRPTIVVLHGFGASPGVFNSAFFSLPWFFGNGCDVMLVTLPFHGPRSSSRLGFDGAELFAGGLVRINEAMLQAVSDIRTLVTHALDGGAPAVGVTGLSLGGYLSATLAAAEPRLAFAIPNAPVADFTSLVDDWFPIGQLLGLVRRFHPEATDELADALSVHSTLRYEPAIDRERLFVIGGLGDRITPPAQARLIWNHWDRCRIHWYPGNHVLHIRRSEYLREVGRFLGRIGFSEPPSVDAA